MEKRNKAQVSVFVIVAILIVGAIAIYFIVRGGVDDGAIPIELSQVFDYYQGCIEQETRAAIEILGSQGGYIEVPDYVPGSEFAPFSSHLNFFGFPVPYWYYVSGNGVVKEQVPAKSEMEKEIALYIEEGLEFCDFESFYSSGFEIEVGAPIVKADIEDTKVRVEVDSEMSVSRGENSASR